MRAFPGEDAKALEWDSGRGGTAWRPYENQRIARFKRANSMVRATPRRWDAGLRRSPRRDTSGGHGATPPASRMPTAAQRDLENHHMKGLRGSDPNSRRKSPCSDKGKNCLEVARGGQRGKNIRVSEQQRDSKARPSGVEERIPGLPCGRKDSGISLLQQRESRKTEPTGPNATVTRTVGTGTAPGTRFSSATATHGPRARGPDLPAERVSPGARSLKKP